MPNPVFAIRFALTPLDKVHSWGWPDAPTLNWFGLTDGSYWLVVEESELFRYSDACLAKGDPSFSPVGLPYLDYYVVRLHEDLLTMLPAVLEPLPADLAALVQTAAAGDAWLTDAEAWLECQPDTDDLRAWDSFYVATLWWDERSLDTGYLTCQPVLRCWRVDDTVFVRWDFSQDDDDGTPIWSAQRGELTLSVAEFLEAVTDFHTRLMTAMRQRLAPLTDDNLNGAAFDLRATQLEQERREHELAATLTEHVAHTDWDAVRRALNELHE